MTRAADTTAPRVASIVLREDPWTSSPTNADSLTWRVTFSEAVSNVDTADFAVTGTTATLSVSAVSGVTGAYDVTASGGNLHRCHRHGHGLSIAAGHDIQDAATNALTNTTPTGTNDNTWMVDNPPRRCTITGVPDTSSSGEFTATFTFSEDVTGFAADITVGNDGLKRSRRRPRTGCTRHRRRRQWCGDGGRARRRGDGRRRRQYGRDPATSTYTAPVVDTTAVASIVRHDPVVVGRTA